MRPNGSIFKVSGVCFLSIEIRWLHIDVPQRRLQDLQQKPVNSQLEAHFIRFLPVFV